MIIAGKTDETGEAGALHFKGAPEDIHGRQAKVESSFFEFFRVTLAFSYEQFCGLL